MTHHAKCGASWTGHRIEHCAASGCCQTFTGQTAADAHRIGSFDDGTRRCMTPAEMRAREPKPLVQDERGFWRIDGPPRNADSWAPSVPRNAEHPSASVMPSPPGVPGASGAAHAGSVDVA